jgi:MHS family proline/betaine transporter-like MFS transporter
MKKILVAGMIGNGLEWYDYALYGQVAWLLGTKFFPSADPVTALLATYGAFAAGFLVRPLGAIFFGWLGDTYGRRTAMVVAVLMMAIPTGCIGLLPTYAQIGVFAPILLTLIRLLQGISLGGEFSGSITYIVESAPPQHRALAGSASLVSLMVGFLLGLFVVRGCMAYFGDAAFEDWAWRLPFIAGIAIGLVGFYIRRNCEESPTFEQAKSEGSISKTPVREALRKHPWEMLQGFAMYMTVTMPFYLSAIYFISYSKNHLGLTSADAMTASIGNMFAMLIMIPGSAWLSDRIGRKPVMMVMAAVICLSVYPLFSHFEMGQSAQSAMLIQFIFALMLGLYMGPVAAVLVELFPTSVRFSGMAIAYNIAAALFGGTAPLVCEWLIGATGNIHVIAYYVMICNVMSLMALYYYKDRYKEPLR